MGMFRRNKNDMAKNSSPPVSAKQSVEKKILGLSKESRELLQQVEERRNKQYLGLIIDATASRAKTWARAQNILEGMFGRLAKDSGLHVRVIYYGGDVVGDLGWKRNVLAVQKHMAAVRCVEGLTRMNTALELMLRSSDDGMAENVVVIGDAYEESYVQLNGLLDRCRRAKVKIFSFFEPGGHSAQTEPPPRTVFEEMAARTGGVFQEYREGLYLDELMVAAAVFTARGYRGLEELVNQKSKGAIAIQAQLLRIEDKKGE